MGKVSLLANEFVTVYSSPDPRHIYSCTPGLVRLETGRLVATMDQAGPGVKDLPGPKSVDGDGGMPNQGRIYASDDRGKTWLPKGEFPFMHARPFEANGSVYVLGHDRDLCVIRSDDGADSWSEPVFLTDGQQWHQSACNVHYANGKVYLVMERRVHFEGRGWPVRELAPVLMSAPVDQDLTRRESWTFANEMAFSDALEQTEVRGVGVPFYALGPTCASPCEDPREMNPVGWLETNVVQFVDPDHIWHDPRGRTFHLWMRAHTGSTGLAAIARAVEQDDGSISTELVRSPSKEPMLFVPCPGGQMRFHILYDDPTRLHWLLSSMATDSMTRPDRLPRDRFDLPNNERHILALHFSRNCVDWCLAGVVARGASCGQARHYASMVIDGDDLHVLSRSGNASAKSAHDTNLITFHTVAAFRDLVYVQ